MASRKENIKLFIIQNISDHKKDIARFTSQSFSVSRQLVNRYINELVDEGIVTAQGKTRREYSLVTKNKTIYCEITPGIEEDQIWIYEATPLFEGVRRNVLDICQYGFTEIVNNAIEHSEGKHFYIDLKISLVNIEISITDDGVGIFKKIKKICNLTDERHAIFELSKGKLTTDPNHHTGEGIFFTSRVFDFFSIYSGSLFFAHTPGLQDWLIDDANGIRQGTRVTMSINTNTTRTIRDVMEQFASKENDFGFSKTIIPVALVRYGDENLVSRSQAKRLLARVDRFKDVILDFDKDNSIGQAFADEIFRVFRADHPDVRLLPINTNPEVVQFIQRALTNE